MGIYLTGLNFKLVYFITINGINSTVGGLLRPFPFGERIKTSEDNLLFNQLSSLNDSIYYVDGFDYSTPEKDWGILLKFSQHAIFYPVFTKCILISRKPSGTWLQWDRYNAI